MGPSDPSQGAAEEEAVLEFKHGFSLEYVIQIVRPGQGPHVMEIHFEGAQLQWPYVMQMDFVWDVADAYKHYFCRPWVAPYPEVLHHYALQLQCWLTRVLHQDTTDHVYMYYTPCADSMLFVQMWCLLFPAMMALVDACDYHVSLVLCIFCVRRRYRTAFAAWIRQSASVWSRHLQCA